MGNNLFIVKTNKIINYHCNDDVYQANKRLMVWNDNLGYYHICNKEDVILVNDCTILYKLELKELA